jgi:hypothetical protein
MPPLHRKPRPLRCLFALFADFAVEKLLRIPLRHISALFADFAV